MASWFTHKSRRYDFGELGLTEPPIIEQLTGLKYKEWAERLDDSAEEWRIAKAEGLDNPQPDLLVMLGMIGAAVAQKYPQWSIDKVVRFVRDRAHDQWEFDTDDPVDDEESEGDAVPPSDAAESGTTVGSATGSETPPETTPDSETLATTGEDGSATTSESASET